MNKKGISWVTAFAIVMAVGFASYFYGARGGVPSCDEPAHILTIRRADSVPDFTQHVAPPVSSYSLMEYVITNHSTSTAYEIKIFYLYPGLQNAYPPAQVANMAIFSGATLLARSPNLSNTVTELPSSTLIIPPSYSRAFSLRANIAGVSSSTASSTPLQAAIGGIFAIPADGSQGNELVYKESNGIVVGRPDGVTDESLESAVFLVP